MPARQHLLRPAALALIALAAIWGYNWIVMKEVLKYSGPFDFAALRAFFGALALFAVLAWRKKPLRPMAFKDTLLLGLLQTTAFTSLTMWALVAGGAGRTAVLVYTMPFWVLILARPLLHERIRGWQWLAVGLAFAGLVFILAPWQTQGSLASSLIATGAGVIWAVSSIIVKRLRRHAHVELLSLTAWQMLLGAVVLMVIALLVPEKPIELTGYFWWALAYNAFLGTALAWLLWLYVLHSLPAGAAGLGTLATPVVGVLAAWIQLGERPETAEIIGMLLVAAGLALLSALAVRQHRRDSPAMAQE